MHGPFLMSTARNGRKKQRMINRIFHEADGTGRATPPGLLVRHDAGYHQPTALSSRAARGRGRMFKVERRGTWVVVCPAGEIDLAVAAEFHATVLGAAACAGHVAIDLSNVTFLDSSGLGVIATALNQVQSGGGQMVLVGLSDRIRSVLEITGMTLVVDVRDDLVGEEQFSVEWVLTPSE